MSTVKRILDLKYNVYMNTSIGTTLSYIFLFLSLFALIYTHITSAQTVSTSVQNCPAITRTLIIGSKSVEVSSLQKFLGAHLGVLATTLPQTGYYGKVTAQYVSQYQKKYGIAQTGSVGPLTRAHIAKQCVSSSNSAPQACTMEYAPVCGQKAGSTTTETFSNTCMLNAAGATLVAQGECLNGAATTSIIVPDLEYEVFPKSGVINLGVKFKAMSKSPTEITNLYVDYGDGVRDQCRKPYYPIVMEKWECTLGHVYPTAGTYTARFILQEGAAEKIIRTDTITVLGRLENQCDVRYVPVCGKNSSGKSVTYHNECSMRQEGGTFVSNGICAQ